MKLISPPTLLAVLGLIATATMTGCTFNSQKDTSIPWSRPANWEGQIPGMGQTQGSPGH